MAFADLLERKSKSGPALSGSDDVISLPDRHIKAYLNQPLHCNLSVLGADRLLNTLGLLDVWVGCNLLLMSLNKLEELLYALRTASCKPPCMLRPQAPACLLSCWCRDCSEV